jgi:hypothetical protein
MPVCHVRGSVAGCFFANEVITLVSRRTATWSGSCPYVPEEIEEGRRLTPASSSEPIAGQQLLVVARACEQRDIDMSHHNGNMSPSTQYAFSHRIRNPDH